MGSQGVRHDWITELNLTDSAIKKKKILPFPTIWVDLQGIMLSEISETEKDKYHEISLVCKSENTANKQVK